MKTSELFQVFVSSVVCAHLAYLAWILQLTLMSVMVSEHEDLLATCSIVCTSLMM